LPRSALVAPGAARCISAGGGADLCTGVLLPKHAEPRPAGNAADGVLSLFSRLGVRRPRAFGPSHPYSRLRSMRRRAFARLSGEAPKDGQRESMLKLILIELLMIVYRCRRRGGANAGPLVSGSRRRQLISGDHRYAGRTFCRTGLHLRIQPQLFLSPFRQANRVHVFEYLNRIRIQKSCLFLKRSSMSIVKSRFPWATTTYPLQPILRRSWE
jgi:hypothetical protein